MLISCVFFVFFFFLYIWTLGFVLHPFLPVFHLCAVSLGGGVRWQVAGRGTAVLIAQGEIIERIRIEYC